MQEVDTLPITLAIEARAAVDAGRLDAAREALAAHPDHSDPDWVASRWYLARAAGADTGPWEAMYDVVRRSDSDPLDRLVPRAVPPG